MNPVITSERLRTKILSIEAWAGGLIEECRQARQLLEGVSTPSNARKGNIEKIAAHRIAKRWQRLDNKKSASR